MANRPTYVWTGTEWDTVADPGAVRRSAANPSNATTLQAAAAANVPLVVQGTTSQTGDLLQARNSGNSVVSSVSSDGRIGVGGAQTPGYHIDSFGKARFLQVDAPTTGAIVIRQPTGDTTAAFIQWVNNANTAQRAWIGADANGISVAGPTGNSSFTVDSTGRIAVTPTVILEAPVVTNTQAGNYTLVRADAGRMIEMSSGSAVTLTIPTDAAVAFPTGTKIDVLRTGAGEITIGGAGVTINSEGSKLRINAQWQAVTLVKRGTNLWVAIGALKA